MDSLSRGDGGAEVRHLEPCGARLLYTGGDMVAPDGRGIA
jgi:hypothetical protein